jgi:hypothetical protein
MDLTRADFLRTALLAPGLGLLAPSEGANGDEAESRSFHSLSNGNHRLRFDSATGGLLSLRASHAPEQEFMPADAKLPVFTIQYLDSENTFRQISSLEAAETAITKSPGGGELIMSFNRLAGRDLHATVKVRISNEEDPSYWAIAIENRTDLSVTDVQFPFIICSYDLRGAARSEALITPFWLGRLYAAPQPQDLEPDSPHAWQFRPENQATWHYPGLTMAQFLSYYNNLAGILVRCLDHSGRVKQIKAVHHSPGVRLGFSHVGDWPAHGARKLEYEIAVQSFEGDWYKAAEIYRDWSLRQPWAQTPLIRRRDVPEWLLESPPHIMIRMQGELDEGPSKPNLDFLPYSKLIPLLERIAEKTASPLVAILMAWERGGPWVYPDCFPPIGGDEAIAEFATEARQRRWHVGSYSNGTRWVTQQFWSGYEGGDFFRENGGAKSVCRTADGQLWRELWDIGWRPSFACCLGVQQTHDLARSYVQRLVSWGLDWIQFLDQNVGCSSFPCYSREHGHAFAPGMWMTRAMHSLLDELDASAGGPGQRQIAFSVESTPNEFFMPRFPLCDVRVSPPGHPGMLAGYVPLYHFLYHEFLLLQGGFGFGPEPYHLCIQNAYNFVLGEIGGGVLTGDGRLLNKDSINWAPWNPGTGSDDDSLEMLRCASALRRGRAKSYVVFGRMEKPARTFDAQTVRWTFEGKSNALAPVFHAAWRAPNLTFALALANWTKDEQKVSIRDERLGERAHLTIMARSETNVVIDPQAIVLPPLSCAIFEAV